MLASVAVVLVREELASNTIFPRASSCTSPIFVYSTIFCSGFERATARVVRRARRSTAVRVPGPVAVRGG